MRTSKLDWTYLARLATQIVGRKTIEGLKQKYPDRELCHPMDIFKLVEPVIRTEVEKMSGPKLGEICTYAVGPAANYQFSGDSKKTPPVFIYSTHWRIVMCVNPDSPGETIMEDIATAVISCVVRDIVLQDHLLTEWQETYGTE